MTMPIYASPEQFMRDRSEYARKGIARGRSVVVTTFSGGVLFVAENHSPTLHKVSEIYDRIGFAGGRPVQRVREPAHGGHPAGRRPRLLLRPPGRHRPLAGQRLRADRRLDLLRAPEAVRGRAVRRRGERRPGPAGSAHRSAPTSSTGSPMTARSPTNGKFVVMGGTTEPVVTALTASFTAGWDLPTALGAAVSALGTAGEGAPRELVPSPTRGRGAGPHRRRPDVPPDPGRRPGGTAGTHGRGGRRRRRRGHRDAERRIAGRVGRPAQRRTRRRYMKSDTRRSSGTPDGVVTPVTAAVIFFASVYQAAPAGTPAGCSGRPD